MGMRLAKDDSVVTAIVPQEDMAICTLSRLGYGKRSQNSEFQTKGRNGQGIIAHQVAKRNDELIGAVQVKPDDELMLINNQGITLRMNAKDITTQSRGSQGVRLMRLQDDQEFVSVARIARSDADLGD
jgi:DNA gyrase subunit A